ncbi:MAG: D-alanine--D-alanine ligase [Thermodesulfovibrio sp.]|nr:D-alanine--D-alanine ligase [Thermodesulfovibrio sp.]MCX7725174.1 D-alanine--D-alanine ligase [Thermodesulfovibrio sp.]MDW7973073.1 D-alanine--D-alanine ligase [Thermodesulfovibrio sp.]
MRVGVIAGGISSEREISLRSGKAIYNALRELGYDVVFIDAGADLCEKIKMEKIDIAFLALHGGWGENGSVQGMLEVMGIPYTGSGVLSSAMAMDKEVTKKIFIYHGIPVPPFKVFYKGENVNPEFLPCVVKPAEEGSSVGVSIVRSEKEFDSAVNEAFKYGKRIIIEKYIEGKEIHIGVLGDKALGGVEVRPKKGFYSYEAKYTKGLTEYILPPEIDETLYEKLKELGVRAHKALNCKGATRIDMIVDQEGNPYVLEVNTIPGMTETSLLPKIASLSGYDFKGLVKEILEISLKENEK